MKNEQLYNKTVDILVQAYFSHTLEHGNCFACAVGNIVAGNCGIKYETIIHHNLPALVWAGHKLSNSNIDGIEITPTYYVLRNTQLTGAPSKTLSMQKSTGYTWDELSRIEKSFEDVNLSIEAASNDDDRMFNGLMAVIDVLDKIHENTDTTVTTQTKKKFNKVLTT